MSNRPLLCFSDLPLQPSVKHTPTKADYRRYNSLLEEVRADIETAQSALARLGRNLELIRDKQLYLCGGYGSFSEFCQKEPGKNRRYAYRLIEAHDTLRLLLESGVSQDDLPETERLCRELRALPANSQPAIWKAVLRIKKTLNRPVTIVDVQQVAAKELYTLAVIERQQAELLAKFEGAGRALKVGLSIDTLSPGFRMRLMAA